MVTWNTKEMEMCVNVVTFERYIISDTKYQTESFHLYTTNLHNKRLKLQINKIK